MHHDNDSAVREFDSLLRTSTNSAGSRHPTLASREAAPVSFSDLKKGLAEDRA